MIKYQFLITLYKYKVIRKKLNLMKPVKLTKEEATKAVKEIVQYGKVEFCGHCKRDSMPKRDVKPTDIIKVLWDGEVKKEAQWDETYKNWKYRVDGLDNVGDELTAITVIYVSELHLIVITVF